jgi:hypothetical protein
MHATNLIAASLAKGPVWASGRAEGGFCAAWVMSRRQFEAASTASIAVILSTTSIGLVSR